MSLLIRKNGSGAAEAGRRARQQASRAVPVAKNAGAAVRQRADDAAAWAGPHVQDARAWAAPHVEQAGIAVQEKLAPQVSDMLTKAARQLDPAPKKRRRSPLAAAVALLAAAASAAAVVALLRRRARPAEADPAGEGAATGAPGTADQASAAADTADAAQADVNGQVRAT